MDNEHIFTTNSYKYLGFIVTPSGEISSGLKDLKDRALKAYYKLKKTMGYYFRLHPTVSIHLFDTLIILLFNSETLLSDGKIVQQGFSSTKHLLFADFYLMDIKTLFRCGVFHGLFNVNVIYILCRCVFL